MNNVEITNEKFYLDSTFKQYMMDISKFPILDENKTKQLFIEFNNGNSLARDLLINSNLRLVVSIAKKYNYSSIMDLIQEGNIGLMKAIDLFDVNKGYRFSTYAVIWIQQAILKYFCDYSRTIRIPKHIKDGIKRINDYKKDYIIKYGYEPALEELEKSFDISADEIEKMMLISESPLSIEKKYDEDTELGDYVSDDINVEEIVMNNMLKDELLKVLDNISPNQRDIIKLRFGFVDNECHTLIDIGNKLGVSKENIRQIQARGLKKLKRLSLEKKLNDYMH